MNNVLSPQECGSLAEVRGEIDRIDREIIRLLAVRSEYVREVVKYKDGTPQGIEAPERRAAVLQTRRQWAAEAGISPDIVEEIYDRLVAYFISEEKKLLTKNLK